jgi:hypothetical protein
VFSNVTELTNAIVDWVAHCNHGAKHLYGAKQSKINRKSNKDERCCHKSNSQRTTSALRPKSLPDIR